MIKKFFLLLTLILFSVNLRAEVVKDIDIIGNKRVSDETIKIYGKIKVNENIDEKKLKKILKNLYSTKFFEDVNIELKNGLLKIKLVEYPTINNLVILGEPSNKYKKQIKEVIQLKEKESFIKSKLKVTNIIKQLYSSLGFNLTEVETKVWTIDSSNVDLVFDIKKGEITKITKITFTGDKIREKRLEILL